MAKLNEAQAQTQQQPLDTEDLYMGAWYVLASPGREEEAGRGKAIETIKGLPDLLERAEHVIQPQPVEDATTYVNRRKMFQALGAVKQRRVIQYRVSKVSDAYIPPVKLSKDIAGPERVGLLAVEPSFLCSYRPPRACN